MHLNIITIKPLNQAVITKIIRLFLLCAIPLFSYGQEVIIPKKNLVNKKWIKDQTYRMNWSMLKDTTRIIIGIVNTKVMVLNNEVQVITEVKLKGQASSWIDSTIVKKSDLSPIYHSSYNAQRDMVIHFDQEINGFYRDKVTQKTTAINEKLQSNYFDSNFYPMLINWLPLKTDYKADINIYDYNPKTMGGIVKVHLLGVKEGRYFTTKSGERKVWIVELTDDIGGGTGAKSIYQIDQITRQLYKQEISIGSRKMEMILLEE